MQPASRSLRLPVAESPVLSVTSIPGSPRESPTSAAALDGVSNSPTEERELSITGPATPPEHRQMDLNQSVGRDAPSTEPEMLTKS